MKETMEFWCAKGGDGCGGYFTVRLRTNINGSYTMICPNCGHHHNRRITGGVITSERRNMDKTEKILVPKSAFTWEPQVDRTSLNEEESQIIEKRNWLWGRFRGR